MHSWIYEDTRTPYTGRVIQVNGIYYSTTHGTMENNSRVVVPMHENGTRTAPSPTSMMNRRSPNPPPTPPRRRENERDRSRMNNMSQRRRTAPSRRASEMNVANQLRRRRIAPVSSPCPPGTYDCNNECIPTSEPCLTCEEQGLITCWNGQCASVVAQCPPDPNFEPGMGEITPDFNDMSGPNISVIDSRVPGTGPGQSAPNVLLGQCYCECAAIDDPNNIQFGMFGFTEAGCPNPGQDCDPICAAHCSQYTDMNGQPTQQLSFSMCYDLTP